jgi:hypothetical protein
VALFYLEMSPNYWQSYAQILQECRIGHRLARMTLAPAEQPDGFAVLRKPIKPGNTTP